MFAFHVCRCSLVGVTNVMICYKLPMEKPPHTVTLLIQQDKDTSKHSILYVHVFFNDLYRK